MNAAPPRLLIIDDDPFVREVTEMSFTSAGGWDVHVADSGAAGLALAAEIRPTVVLLDFLMPDMDGPTTLAALHAADATRDVPVIFVTADELSARNAARLAAANVIGVIAKPFDPMTLPDEVAALVDATATATPTDEPADGLAAALAQLWEARRPETLTQIDELDAAIADATSDREHTRLLAHNLVGVLGSLGLYESSALARTIDRALRSAVADGLTESDRAGLAAVARQLRERVASERPSM